MLRKRNAATTIRTKTVSRARMFGAPAYLFALVVIIVSGAEAVRADQISVRKSLPETDIIACIKTNDTLDESTRSSMQQRCVRDAQLYCADKQPDCIAQIVTDRDFAHRILCVCAALAAQRTDWRQL